MSRQKSSGPLNGSRTFKDGVTARGPVCSHRVRLVLYETSFTMLIFGGDFSRWCVRRLRWSGLKTFVEKHTRTALLWLGCVLIASLPLGCITVNPTPDYAHASALIAERTGSGDVYDPQAESLIKDKISVLLADRLTTPEAVQLALLNNRAFQSAEL